MRWLNASFELVWFRQSYEEIGEALAGNGIDMGVPSFPQGRVAGLRFSFRSSIRLPFPPPNMGPEIDSRPPARVRLCAALRAAAHRHHVPPLQG